MTDDNPRQVIAFMERSGIHWPVLWDRGQLKRQFGVNTIPFNVYIDKDGKVAGDVTGNIDEDDAAELLERLRTAK